MKIVGFGDSFITPSEFDYAYTNVVAKHFGSTFESFGLEGTGAWDAYFQFERYVKHNGAPDVAMFVWSASDRFYNSKQRQICWMSTVNNRESSDPTWIAARHYFDELWDPNKTDIEHTCFYFWFDDYLHRTYPNLKVIHMWGFPKKYCDYGNPSEMEYLHTFTNAVEIRPALIHLSFKDEWPTDLKYETRVHHLTPNMHSILSTVIIAAIENYTIGKKVQIIV